MRRLRVLEEVTKQTNCVLISSENNAAYNCSVPVDEDKELTMSANDDFVFEGLGKPDIVISSYAKNAMKKLSDQTGDPLAQGVLTLSNSILTQKDRTFTVEGTLLENESLKDDEITLSLENANENLVNVSCNVNNKGNQQYELVCNPKKAINAHLDGVMGSTSTKPLLISMAEGQDDSINLQSKKGKFFLKNDDSKLSGGAIAGIVIACCVALIASAIVALLFVSKRKPPVEQASSIELYTPNRSGNYVN